MALWLPPCSLTPRTSLHLPTLLLCSLSNVTLFHTQGWGPGRSADRDLALWDICFIIDLFNPKPLLGWKCARLPRIGSFWRHFASSFQGVVHWGLQPVGHTVWERLHTFENTQLTDWSLNYKEVWYGIYFKCNENWNAMYGIWPKSASFQSWLLAQMRWIVVCRCVLFVIESFHISLESH